MRIEKGSSPENPITHATEPWADKWCQCYACQTVRLCSEEFDFYVLANDPKNGPLYGECCFLRMAPGPTIEIKL